MLKEERELPILRLLDEIWYHIMNDRAKKLTAAKKAEADGIRWTSIVTAEFNESKRWARTNTVYTSFILSITTNLSRLSRFKERTISTVVFSKTTK